MFSSGTPGSSMRIGLARRGYSATGGAESYLRRFAEALRAAGHRPVLYGGPEWRDAGWEHGELRVLDGRSPQRFANALRGAAPGDCDRLFSLERAWECDAYRAGDGVHRAWLERRRAVEWPGAGAWRALQPKHRQLLRLEESLFGQQNAGRVIAKSRLVRDEIRRFFGYPEDRLSVVYNGLPRQPELPAEVRQNGRAALGAKPGDCLALFAGSGWERKGLRFAVEAVAALPAASRVKLIVAGRGPAWRYRGGRVVHLGPRRDLRELLEAADVFLLPTLYDPFSNACLEALAAGLPVITTAANGFSEIIAPGEEGEVLADPADTSALAAAIQRWADPVRTASVRARLRALARTFTAERNVRETLAVLA